MKNTDNKFNEKQRKTASSTYPPRNLNNARKRLKGTMLEALDNQLSIEDCPFGNEAYHELLMRGYNGQQAKEKIGAV